MPSRFVSIDCRVIAMRRTVRGIGAAKVFTALERGGDRWGFPLVPHYVGAGNSTGRSMIMFEDNRHGSCFLWLFKGISFFE